ncbi:branched-subunit amino acid aminotransferase/4-amino-4-deoxychorismate lyase [Variovorax boronicumulans]|uniref:aminotransferase class IV family protein n=1 Tax=Variovorax boronicumulans TaxID=436515 RepID=UPI00277EC294|nr:aminotransferase class IV family protein [Variovorax boronicumulans]MDP9920043.1 branched-subunit amino acid aminotransferase/4-amino-4-deoxychorismate lyase [Variovorax boronicumulans]
MSASVPSSSTFVVQRNGQPATAEALAPLAFAGHAHFTAMQVRGGRVRGLDLHLARLRFASQTLFGQALPDDTVRAHLRAALAAGPTDLSLTATVYSPAGEFTAADAVPEVLIRTGLPSNGPAGPLTLAAIEHERFLPSVKHVGEGAKTQLLRQAAAQGFDDAAFLDRHGRLGEASIWNLAFWDGEAVVWPEAEILAGTTMGIVRRQLERLGVPQRSQVLRMADLPALAGAVVMNSWTPGVAVHRIGDVVLPPAPAFVELLHRAHAAEPLASP